MRMDRVLPFIAEREHERLMLWLSRWTNHETATAAAAGGFADLVLAACEGSAAPNGPYVALYNLTYVFLTALDPGLVHRMGVDWRRTIPIPEKEELRQFVDCYTLIHALGLLTSIDSYQVKGLTAEMHLVMREGNPTSLANLLEFLPAEVALVVTTAWGLLRETGKMLVESRSDLHKLRDLLYIRSYNWANTQLSIRSEKARGTAEQDHHPRQAVAEAPEHFGLHVRQVGIGGAQRDDDQSPR